MSFVETEQEMQHSKRVLRARGISSYTEQFYSDDESDENQLEEWTDVEAVYAAPGIQANTSASHVDPKDRNTGSRSEEEDSDQDWILPSSRKRKNKRSCKCPISKKSYIIFSPLKLRFLWKLTFVFHDGISLVAVHFNIRK